MPKLKEEEGEKEEESDKMTAYILYYCLLADYR